jgi:hypothetical protein
MKELRKCCEYCEYYTKDYRIKCNDCRDGHGICNHSQFEVAKELQELERLAEIGRATKKLFDDCECIIMSNLEWDDFYQCEVPVSLRAFIDVEQLLKWAK